VNQARLRAFALACAVAAPSAAPASAQPQAGRNAIYLPIAQRGGKLVHPCAPAAGGACPVAGGWRLVCGGFGALRDLYAPPGSATALGIGDGAARLRITTPPGARPMPGEWWFEGQIQPASPDYDRVLNGLRGFSVAGCRIGEPSCPEGAAWGVGDRPWVARYDGTCWRPDAPIVLADGTPVREGDARLRSMVPTRSGGLAVGERAGTAAHAVPIERSGGGTAWRLSTASAGAGLPALFDVDVLSGPFDADAWAVGRDGLVARMQLADDAWRPTAQLAEGTARELTMLSSAEGWAFGMATDAGDIATTVVWRYDGTAWVEDARYPGQALIDAYKDFQQGENTILLGLTPGGDAAPGVPVLHQRTAADGWRPIAGAPPLGAVDTGDGRGAIAPMEDGRVLYAAGSGIWLFDATAGWTQLRRRVDLSAVVPDNAGAWVLAGTDGGSRVLRLDAAGRLFDPDAAGADLPPLRAMAGGTELWAVGDAGATWRQVPPRGAWAPAVPAGREPVDLVDIARDDAGGLWSAGSERAEGRMLVWDAGAGRWQPVAAVTEPLRAIAPLAGGGAVAVGGRTIVTVQPAARCRDGATTTVVAAGQRWCVAVLVACFDGSCLDDLASVATAPGALWVADRTTVIRHRAGGAPDRWQARDWAPSIPAVQGVDKPFESSIIALAATDPDDGWAVFQCCTQRDDPGSEMSYAVRLDDGHWAEAVEVDVPLRDAAVAPDGTLMLAGDWSTLVARSPR